MLLKVTKNVMTETRIALIPAQCTARMPSVGTNLSRERQVKSAMTAIKLITTNVPTHASYPPVETPSCKQERTATREGPLQPARPNVRYLSAGMASQPLARSAMMATASTMTTVQLLAGYPYALITSFRMERPVMTETMSVMMAVLQHAK